MADEIKEGAARVSFPGVELTKVGKWDSTLGPVEVTGEDIAAMVEAEADRVSDPVPTKPGHFDPRFDGDPALGWVRNLRVNAAGDTLIGDIADVPESLAPLIRDGYRRRSVEFDRNVKAKNGKTYRAILTGLALLGAKRPAVSGLADLPTVYASGHEPTAAAVVADDTHGVPHAVPAGGDPGTNPARLSGDNDEVEGGSDVDLTKIKELLGLDPDTSDDDTLTAAQSAISDGLDALAQIRSALGLPEDAPVADILSAIPVAASHNEGDGKEGGANLSGREDVVMLSRGQWEQVQASEARLSALEAAETERRVSVALSGALDAGKITPAEEDHWRKALNENYEGTTRLLSGMAARFATRPTPEAHAALSGDDLAADVAAAKELGW